MQTKYMRLNLDDYVLILAVPAALFLIFHIVAAVMVGVFHENSSVLIAGVALPVVEGFSLFGAAAATILSGYDYVLSHSCTRKRAMKLVFTHLLSLAGAACLWCWALSALEHGIFPSLWKILGGFSEVSPGPMLIPEGGSAPEGVLFVNSFYMGWWWAPVNALAGMVLGIVGGGIVRRFGHKGGWTLYAVGMLALLGYNHGGDQIQAMMPLIQWAVCVAAVGAFIWVLRDLLKGDMRV